MATFDTTPYWTELTRILQAPNQKIAHARFLRLKIGPTCGRCGGSGSYSFNLMDGSKCYGCNGAGVTLPKNTAKAWKDAIERAKEVVAKGTLRDYLASLEAQKYAKQISDNWFKRWKESGTQGDGKWMRDVDTIRMVRAAASGLEPEPLARGTAREASDFTMIDVERIKSLFLSELSAIYAMLHDYITLLETLNSSTARKVLGHEDALKALLVYKDALVEVSHIADKVDALVPRVAEWAKQARAGEPFLYTFSGQTGNDYSHATWLKKYCGSFPDLSKTEAFRLVQKINPKVSSYKIVWEWNR